MITRPKNKYKYTGKSALVVEPTDIMRSALVKMLREVGMHPIHQAVRGTEAQRMLSQVTPNIIVSEWSLDGLGGLDLLNWCRSREQTKDTPFIFCTSVVDQITVLEALKAGVSEFIAKPFSLATFEKHIDKALKLPLTERFEENSPISAKSDNEALGSANISKRLTENETAPFTMLLVSTNSTEIESALKVISKFGSVKRAIDGEAAVKMCSEYHPDLILLNINPSGVGGYQTLELLKNDPLTQSIPVVVLTSKSSDEDLVKLLSLGASDFVTKPINTKILQVRVVNQKRIIDAHRALQIQVQSYIDNFTLKVDLERVLFEHLHVPLNELEQVSKRLIKKGITHSQVTNEGIVIEKVRTTISRLIESLNSTVNIEDSNFRPIITSINLSSVIEQVVGDLQKELNDKSLIVGSNFEEEVCVQGEFTLLYIMFSSLFLNAIEAAPQGSQINISHKKEDGMIVITFFNRGAVDKEIRNRFFDKYVSKGKASGIGLGTYSAKLITDLLGGYIYLDASDEETRVHVKLKKAKP